MVQNNLNVIVGQTVNFTRNGSTALAKIGRSWTVVRQSNRWPGRVYVNEVGGDGHRVTARGYRKIDTKGGALRVGVHFMVGSADACGSYDSGVLTVTKVPYVAPAYVAPTPVAKVSVGYAVINGVTYSLVK